MSNGSADYTYHYDHIGNVQMVTYSSGYKAYSFNQDAYGNELSLAGTAYTGSAWSSARSAGVHEHQTGKTLDPLTGLYFFHDRWYDGGVGRFVGRDPVIPAQHYIGFANMPSLVTDPTGLCGCQLEGSARSMSIRMRKCYFPDSSLEGSSINLSFAPASNPWHPRDGYDPNHIGWSIPTGTYSVRFDPKESAIRELSRNWFRIYNEEPGLFNGYDWIINDPILGDWEGVSIHISGTYSAGCWSLPNGDFEKLKKCCGTGSLGDKPVDYGGFGSIKIIDRIYGPDDPFWFQLGIN